MHRFLLLCAGTCLGLSAADVRVEQPWARASSPSATTGAAYGVLVNDGDQADSLESATCDVAEDVELHTHLTDARGVKRMTAVDHIDLPPHSRTPCQPGGMHIMLFGLKRPLVAGERFTLTCTFTKAGTITVPVVIGSAVASAPPSP